MFESLNIFINYLKHNIRYLLSLCFSTVCLSIFILIARNLHPTKSIHSFDENVSRYISIHRSRRLTSLVLFITKFGDLSTIVTLFILLGSYLFKTRHWNTLVALIIGIGGGQMFIIFTKLLIKRQRPNIISRLVSENSFSFPSGHSFTVVCFYGFIIYLVHIFFKGSIVSIIIEISSALIILLVGFSRVYLGVHWFSDVIASFAAGTGWLTAVLTILQIKKIYSK